MGRGQGNGQPLVTRLWAGVDKRGPDDCWLWTRSRYGLGYGVISRPHPSGKGIQQIGAHRAAYELTYGPVPIGHYVCHRCDTPPCCNPSHLFVGTARDNVQDCVKKGRRSKKRAPYNTGETNSHAAMSENTALEIIGRVRNGEQQTQIARSLGVDKGTIWRLVRGHTWKHLHSKYATK